MKKNDFSCTFTTLYLHLARILYSQSKSNNSWGNNNSKLAGYITIKTLRYFTKMLFYKNVIL